MLRDLQRQVPARVPATRSAAAGVPAGGANFVAETRFGKWFIGTETWAEHVLARALKDLVRLMRHRRPSDPTIVDVGCGWGRSFKLLHETFAPCRMIGIDPDTEMLRASAIEAARQGLTVELVHGTGSRLTLADGAVDMVFCHQTFHHLIEQESAIREFYRVLKPGGALLFAESTSAYINSWIIRLLFRHPMEVQKTAAEYLALVRAAGFVVEPDAISYPHLWWSRPDLGLGERVLGIAPSPTHEETLINLVAVRP